MTLEEARAILGIPSDLPADEALKKMADARERLAEMVRTSPTEKLAGQFQSELERFDQAMAALREEAERRRYEKLAGVMALVPGAVSGSHVRSKREGFLDEPAPPKQGRSPDATQVVPPPSSPPPPPPARPVEPSDESIGEPERRSSKGRFVSYAIIFMVIGGIAGGWLYTQIEKERALRRTTEIMFLEKLGAGLVSTRRWDEAGKAYLRIEELEPGSEIAQRGRRSIEVGMREEQEQFVGYWSGEAQAAFEAGRLDDAREAVEKVLERYPTNKIANALAGDIQSARLDALRKTLGGKIREAIEKRDWQAAEAGVAELANAIPEDGLITVLAREIAIGREKERADLQRARELAASAKLRDPGKFDPEVLEWAREALALAPHDPEVRAIYDKIASYSRTLNVPADVESLALALQSVRPKDRIVLGEGTFEGGVVINVPIQLEGSGDGESVLESPAEQAPTITFGPGASGSVVTGISFRCKGFDTSDERYPAVQVRGAAVEFTSCEFKEASGNGLEVMDGGTATAVQCTFEGNGWDGFAARGKGSRMVARQSRAISNFGHGFESWDGASAVIQESEARGNSRNGILVDSAADDLEITGSLVAGNREYGILLSAGAAGKVSGNECTGNRLGGMLVRFAAMSVLVEGNEIEKNSGDGLVLEQGLRVDTYESNRLRGNQGRNLRDNVSFAGGN